MINLPIKLVLCIFVNVDAGRTWCLNVMLSFFFFFNVILRLGVLFCGRFLLPRSRVRPINTFIYA